MTGATKVGESQPRLLEIEASLVERWCFTAMLRSKALPKDICWFDNVTDRFIRFDEGDPDKHWIALSLTRQCKLWGLDRYYVFSHVLFMPERHNKWPSISQGRFLTLLHN